MKYLPILQELFESDTLLFLILGILLAIVVGLRLREGKRLVPAIVISAAGYGVCEIASHIHTNFMLELILVFAGTVLLGGCIGFLACLVINRFRRNG